MVPSMLNQIDLSQLESLADPKKFQRFYMKKIKPYRRRTN